MPNECHEEIAGLPTGDYDSRPCDRPAVGWRVDPEQNAPYPVCATHHRWPYADEWVALAAQVQRVRDLADEWEARANAARVGGKVGDVRKDNLTLGSLVTNESCAREVRAALDGTTAEPEHEHSYGDPVPRTLYPGDPTWHRYCTGCVHFQFSHDPGEGTWYDAAPPRRLG